MMKSFAKIILISFLSAIMGCLFMYAVLNLHPMAHGNAAASDLAAATVTSDRDAVVKAVKIISPAVVNIDTKAFRKVVNRTITPGDGFMREFFGDSIPFREYHEEIMPQKGMASGVIISSNGLILTNDHVVRGADEIIVTLGDKKQYKATLKGSDRISDIAILKIDANNLPVAAIGDSDSVEVGEWVIAVGNPYGYEHTVTVGVISGRKRHLSDSTKDYQDLLQTDAAINPGNSGGPLCDLDGRVIGINTAIVPFAQGIGFAIPINSVQKIRDVLIEKGKVSRPYIGIYMQEMTRELAEYLGTTYREGVLVMDVAPDGPAQKAGINKGDILLEVEKQKVKSPEEVRKLIQVKKIGDTVRLLVSTEKGQNVVSLKIGEMP